MKKTITINLNGTIFNIEEDGYSILKNYLDSIRSYFSVYDDHQEIMNDIEARAAEQFSEKITQSKQAISLEDVNQLINCMGTIEDIAENEKTSQSKEEIAAKSFQEKKLYRDPDHAVIMGVAAGIAAYFGIDVVFIRLAFVVSLFFGGAGILIYLILCFVVPEAKTTAQKMQMQGQRVNLSNLKEAVDEKISSAKDNLTASKPFIRRFVVAIIQLVKKLGAFFSIVIGLGILAGMLAAFTGILFVFGNLIFNANSPYMDFPIKEFLSGINYIIALAAGFLVAFIPVLMGIIISISLIRRRLKVNLAVAVILLMFWILSLTTVGIYAIRIAPQYNEKVKSIQNSERLTRNYDFRDFNQLTLVGNQKVTVVQSNEFKVQAVGRDIDLEATNVSLENQTLTISEHYKNKICVFCFDSRRAPEFIIYMPVLNNYQAVGNVKGEIQNFNQTDMKMDLQDISNTRADVKVENLSVRMDGVPKLTLVGTGQNLTAKIIDQARLYAFDYLAENVKLMADNGGKIQVNAAKTLDVAGSGFGKVQYKGQPEVTKKTNGQVRVEKYDESGLDESDFEN